MESDPPSKDPAALTLATPEDGMHQAETGTTSCSTPEGTTLGATLRQSVAQQSPGETELYSYHQQPGARLTAPLDDTPLSRTVTPGRFMVARTGSSEVADSDMQGCEDSLQEPQQVSQEVPSARPFATDPSALETPTNTSVAANQPGYASAEGATPPPNSLTTIADPSFVGDGVVGRTLGYGRYR